MFRFRFSVAAVAVMSMFLLASVIISADAIVRNVGGFLAWLAYLAKTPQAQILFKVGLAAALAGFTAGLPNRMPRFGGAPPRGALVRLLTPVCVMALMAVAAAAWLTWSVEVTTDAFELALLQLTKGLAGIVLVRCLFLLHRLSSDYRLAVQSADWP